MTTATATKPKAPAKPKAPTPAPAPEAKAPEVKAPVREVRTNPAYAPEAIRNKVTQAMADLGALGFTRPAISQHTGLSLGAVWRAQNDKVHTAEVETYEAFTKAVLDGKITPPERKPSKVSAAVLQERVAKATGILEAQKEAKNVSALRKLVDDALAALTA